MRVRLFILLALFSTFTNATDINCKGSVTAVMNYEPKCNGNYSFQTTGSGGKWMCPATEKGNAIVLAALAAGKEVAVYIDNQNGTISCADLPSYTPARYLIIYP
jgi:hypothetical protein